MLITCCPLYRQCRNIYGGNGIWPLCKLWVLLPTLLKIIFKTLINIFTKQVQFLVVFCHTIQIQFQPNCNFSKSIGALLSLNAALFTYMFSSFYIKSYNRAAKREADERKLALDENNNQIPIPIKVTKAEWEDKGLSVRINYQLSLWETFTSNENYC